jgi:toxin YhaV
VTKNEPPKPAWRLYVHPAFSEAFDALVAEVKRLQTSDPGEYGQHPKAKLLKRIVDLVETEIPRDPGAAEFNLGNTLGPAHRHWRRAKFLSRFRLFFRYNSKAAVIIYAWVNDENTLRKAGSGNDPYHLFGGMLRKGRPPDDWIALTKEAAAYVPPKLEGKPPLPERGAARAITKDEM